MASRIDWKAVWTEAEAVILAEIALEIGDIVDLSQDTIEAAQDHLESVFDPTNAHQQRAKRRIQEALT